MKLYVKFVLDSISSDIQVQEPGCLVSHIDDNESFGIVISNDVYSYVRVLWSIEPISSIDRQIKSRIDKALITLIGHPVTDIEASITQVMTIFRDHGKIGAFVINCPTTHVMEIKYFYAAMSTFNIITIEF